MTILYVPKKMRRIITPSKEKKNETNNGENKER